ncbi:methylated-DNA--[protein]-cysteine S-methyltransferase [Fodinicola feengrottensis]|uniref:methylated-DNA--[protein]-cysteine S-methyltransferase n=1 Tax=Fodinicola feengrottensis TaxID=435914 RepID=UPI002440F7F2|nr:methylated-DNA--[protein]-cysteine S-methyltransferase [Fodinicola feengrottensis]
MTVYTTASSPAGDLLLVGEQSATGLRLTAVSFAGKNIQPDWEHDPAAFEKVTRQLAEYFAGDRQAFELDCAESGTEFQRRVWAALETIPYGQTVTYGWVTAQVGAPRERVRAVAAAIGANPLLVVRPCHRVIGADGSLTGYAAGLERKEFLLTLEGALQPHWDCDGRPRARGGLARNRNRAELVRLRAGRPDPHFPAVPANLPNVRSRGPFPVDH